MCRISIVIPALNEEHALPKTLDSISMQNKMLLADVIVVDGGSEDRTVDLARSSGATVATAQRGRAKQMNLGASLAVSAASCDVLIFLHADTSLPGRSLDAIGDAMKDPAVVGGCFQQEFDIDDSLLLRAWTFGSRCCLFKTPRLVFGDRAIFVRAQIFEQLGGFMEWPILEDVDFAMRLSRVDDDAVFAFLDLAAITSARRFAEKGYFQQCCLNGFILACWYAGYSPEQIKDWYVYKAPCPPEKRFEMPPLESKLDTSDKP
mmetsp:Transcript_122439/g.215687  ORF Transcript_122439/g.215687 Transcript_122439/m.215687 type:complete len:262 (+) Transcript_122439:50-835(+)